MKVEPFKVSLKKVKKKPIQEAKLEEAFVPIEEVTEFTPDDAPSEIIQFVGSEEGMDICEISTEGVFWEVILGSSAWDVLERNLTLEGPPVMK